MLPTLECGARPEPRARRQKKNGRSAVGRSGRYCLTKEELLLLFGRLRLFRLRGVASGRVGSRRVSRGGLGRSSLGGRLGSSSLGSSFAATTTRNGESRDRNERNQLGNRHVGFPFAENRRPSDAFQTPRYSESAQNPRKSIKISSNPTLSWLSADDLSRKKDQGGLPAGTWALSATMISIPKGGH
jgi:hypothetical protein